MVKAYILDTNILLDSPRAIFGFDDNTVIITGTTLQELDSKKTAPGELGFNARETCRIIENSDSKGILPQECQWIMRAYLKSFLMQDSGICQVVTVKTSLIIR